MSVISATSRRCKTLADGTLQLIVEIEPRNAQDAFQLFGMPDVPMVLARLTQEAAQQSARDETIAADKPKGGALAKLAGMWCNDPAFWEWLETDENNCAHGERGAALCLYDICGIKSRAELDNDPEAAEKFHKFIREPYSEWLKKRGPLDGKVSLI